jgi:hypothetical protein
MARRKNEDEQPRRRRPPARTPRARENQLISLAYDRVEDRMRTGEASAQEYSHFLKAGSTREYLEQERIAMQSQLDRAKIEQMAALERRESLFKDAIRAMKSYQGEEPLPEDDDDDYYDD